MKLHQSKKTGEKETNILTSHFGWKHLGMVGISIVLSVILAALITFAYLPIGGGSAAMGRSFMLLWLTPLVFLLCRLYLGFRYLEEGWWSVIWSLMELVLIVFLFGILTGSLSNLLYFLEILL